jgi:hypothetical protein
MAIGLGALWSVPASAAAAPTPSSIPKRSAVINTSALGTLATSGQQLASSNVEQVQRRGRSARRGGRSFRGGRAASSRAFRSGRSVRGRSLRSGRSYRRRAIRSGRAFRGGRGAYRGRYYRPGWRGSRYWYGRRWVGPAVTAGIAALIIGGTIAESKARYGDRWERCAARFRSFRWSDGTYQPYGGGPRRLCPHLRR